MLKDKIDENKFEKKKKKKAKHYGLPSSIIKRKKAPPKPVNWGNLDYLIKLANHANLIKRQNKKKKKIMNPNSQPPQY